MNETLVIVGPGGIGKSPLDKLIKDSVIRLDPYRLRKDGPRDEKDILYAHPKLACEIESVLEKPKVINFQTKNQEEEIIKWFPKSKVLLFTVRGEWQLLFLPKKDKEKEEDVSIPIKMEIYAPVLLTLLEKIPDFAEYLGKIKIVILNPADKSLCQMGNWKAIKKVTEYNCKMRGDSLASIKKRKKSVDDEAPSWKELIETYKAIEMMGWKFPEYVVTKNNNKLLKACKTLLNQDPELAVFFK